MRTRSSSIESLVCALYLSTLAAHALPLRSLWSRSASPDVAYGQHIADPRVQDFAEISIASTPDVFQSQDIAPSYVRPSRRRTKGVDGLPARLADQADELDFGPDASTFAHDFHEAGDEQHDNFWHVMGALQASTENAYENMFGVPSFKGLGKLLPFLKRGPAHA